MDCESFGIPESHEMSSAFRQRESVKMATVLKEDFVERRCHTCRNIPVRWKLDSQGQFFELDLKMCQLKSLEYAFRWGKESGPLPRMSSIIETPSRIVKLDLSLNELKALDHASLQPFKNLRDLNASLNRISNFMGIEVLPNLYSLNLSHNFIKKIENLVPSMSIVELNLSMNELVDISYIPSLINLESLNVSNNKLKTLDGVQSLPRLRELYAQRNDLQDAIPLASCFHLQIVNLADNHIVTLNNTVDILAKIKRLEVLSLHGNPIDRDPLYRDEILRSTNVMTLDNISVRPLPKQSDPDEYDQYEPEYKHKHNIHTLKQAARQAFEEKMKDNQARMADQIGFLQRRIVHLQSEYQEYEARLQTDLDSCLRYLDSLTDVDSSGVNRHQIRDAMGTPAPKPWHRERHKDPRADYTHIKQTEEVLKFASLELRNSSR